MHFRYHRQKHQPTEAAAAALERLGAAEGQWVEYSYDGGLRELVGELVRSRGAETRGLVTLHSQVGFATSTPPSGVAAIWGRTPLPAGPGIAWQRGCQ